MRELPEKRFGGNGQSAVVGAAKRAALTRKKRRESRRGGRSRLWKNIRIGVSACTVCGVRASFRLQHVTRHVLSHESHHA